MNYNLPKDLLRGLQQQSDLVTRVEELAQRHGCNSNAGVSNSVAFLERKLAELEEAEQKVRQLGYKSLSAALYGLSKQNKFPNVPTDLQQVPQHWVYASSVKKETVWKNSKQVEKVYKVPGVTATQARQKLNGLLPYLDQLLEGANAEYVNSVRENHRDVEVTFDEFAHNCHSNLAEEAGLGTTWEAEALPPAEETTTTRELAPYSAEEEALLQARLTQSN